MRGPSATLGGLRVEPVYGSEVAAYRTAVSQLRLQVFRDYPYLYDGNEAEEEAYMACHLRSPHTVWALAFDGTTLVGASTALPLVEEEPPFRAPLEAGGIAPDQVFYLGESVLLPAYRGRGLGHRFFDLREAQARACGYRFTAFAAVVRSPDDPRRPPGHRDLSPFWTGRGYQHHPDWHFELDWREVGDADESPHRLSFWIRPV